MRIARLYRQRNCLIIYRICFRQLISAYQLFYQENGMGYQQEICNADKVYTDFLPADH
jgi:hypothetical protein